MPATKNTSAPKRPRGRPPIREIHPPDGAEFLMIQEVAAKLRVSDDTVRRLITGDDDTPPVLASVRVSEGNIRIPAAALQAYINSRTTQAAAARVGKGTRSKMGMGQS